MTAIAIARNSSQPNAAAPGSRPTTGQIAGARRQPLVVAAQPRREPQPGAEHAKIASVTASDFASTRRIAGRRVAEREEERADTSLACARAVSRRGYGRGQHQLPEIHLDHRHLRRRRDRQRHRRHPRPAPTTPSSPPNGMTKGSMQLIFSPEEADALYAKMGPGQRGVGRVGGEHDRGHGGAGSAMRLHRPGRRRPAGRRCSRTTSARRHPLRHRRARRQPTTGRCLIFVTPDGQRTMNTFLGASQFLPAAALDRATDRGAAHTCISRAICGIPRSRARRCAPRSTSRARRGARSRSRCRRVRDRAAPRRRSTS